MFLLLSVNFAYSYCTWNLITDTHTYHIQNRGNYINVSAIYNWKNDSCSYFMIRVDRCDSFRDIKKVRVIIPFQEDELVNNNIIKILDKW